MVNFFWGAKKRKKKKRRRRKEGKRQGAEKSAFLVPGKQSATLQRVRSRQERRGCCG
jgi:hypothetical protein